MKQNRERQKPLSMKNSFTDRKEKVNLNLSMIDDHDKLDSQQDEIKVKLDKLEKRMDFAVRRKN